MFLCENQNQNQTRPPRGSDLPALPSGSFFFVDLQPRPHHLTTAVPPPDDGSTRERPQRRRSDEQREQGSEVGRSTLLQRHRSHHPATSSTGELSLTSGEAPTVHNCSDSQHFVGIGKFNRAKQHSESKMSEKVDSTTVSGGSSLPTVKGAGHSVKECEDMIHRAFRTPTVKFLKEHLEKLGCTIGDNFIKAVNCDKQIGGGYVRGQGIMVCANHMNYQDEVNQVVIHELIHAYDECRAKNLDWTNCAHHACSEIRAGHLSGDCHYKRELLRGYMKIRGHEQECVRRRVMKSVIANPYCSEAAARDAMEVVWDVCYNDTKPFDRAP